MTGLFPIVLFRNPVIHHYHLHRGPEGDPVGQMTARLPLETVSLPSPRRKYWMATKDQ